MEQVLVVSSILLWVVVICNVILTLALIRRVNEGTKKNLPDEGLKEGEQAPDFTAETLNSEQVSLATYAQRAIAFLFVEPGCGPCREALPSYEALEPKAARSGVELVLVSLADAERTRHFVDQFNIRLPVIVAPQESNSFMTDYKVSGTPFYCLVNSQGKVQSSGFPSLQWGKWKALAEAWETNTTRPVGIAMGEGR